MKIKLFYAFIVSSLFFVFEAYSASMGAPKISSENTTYNFGSVSEGSRVEHTFELKNTGN